MYSMLDAHLSPPKYTTTDPRFPWRPFIQQAVWRTLGRPPVPPKHALTDWSPTLARLTRKYLLIHDLSSFACPGQRGPRTNAREKLTRLSQQQFTELSTDVYDELMRRINNAQAGQGM